MPVHSKLNFALSLALAAALLLTFTVAPSLDAAPDHHGSKSAMKADKNLVEVAVGAGQFETLVAAVQAAGLAETLAGDGPFTVFAPTDDAFAALPAGTVENLLKPENKDQLVDLLKYHVVSGKVTAEQASQVDSAETLAGGSLEIEPADGTLMINDARVVKADVMASNGVIHVVDKVLMP